MPLLCLRRSVSRAYKAGLILCFIACCPLRTALSFELKWKLDEIYGERGREQIELKKPTDLALIEKDHELAVLDERRESVVFFDDKGEWVRTVCDSGKCSGARLDDPKAIDADDEGNIWVVDSGNHRLVVLDPNGGVVRIVGESGTQNGRFRHPSDIALYKNKVYVADTGNERIQVFNTTGDFLSSWEKRTGGRKGHLDEPVAVAVSQRRKAGIWVANKGEKKLELFDLDGEWEESLEIPVDGAIDVHPGGLAIDSRFERMFIVAQFAAAESKIIVLDHRGRFVAEVSRPDGGETLLGGLSLGRQLSLLVVDVNNAVILKFVLD